MSGIDLSNPQVLANFVKAKIKEGNGEFIKKEKVDIFVSEDGSEYIVPEDVKIPKQKENKKDAKKDDKKEKDNK